MSLARRAGAFLRRDALEEWSYPWVPLSDLAAVVGTVCVFYLMGRLVGTDNPHLQEYGGDYFLFAIFGVVAMDFLWATLKGFNDRVRYHQLSGTLEACLVTRTPLWQVILLGPTYLVTKAVFRLVVYLVGAVAFVGAQFAWSGLAPALLAAILGLVVFASLGMISASITLVIKRGDPVAYLMNGASLLIGGVLYPVELLPGWLQSLAWLVPVRAVLDCVRGALQGGAGWAEVATPLAGLALYAAVVLPLAWWAIRWANAAVRRDGTIGHY